ncbi:futalosine hydrolase [Anaerobacillus alkalidiazotrophicus]|uniref:Futalosine hydrolase n=1 Tax=Anaerobacillus alkalidiazotrophicus TaxID=472963 RepID=A0A1S2M9N6_9BACI|nr:futalosine hydrolase [Anaerobacillus alkalidiazotrophicus]OIJ21326.1 futalosine hydrolase [Anaerobacillus alkalidiazotrophicus]
MNGKVLIMTAVKAEQEAVLRGLNGDSRFDVIVAGVGQVAAAITTTKALATSNFHVVISAGIGGGFRNQAETGSVVVSSEIIAADLGAQTVDGFSTVEELGFGFSRVSVDRELVIKVTETLKNSGMIVKTGPILTLSTVTGTEETAQELAARFSGATAEAMEGFGVASAAKEFHIPCLEIRTISNPVGPRDRSAWKIKEALEALEKVSSILPEVLN